MKNDPAGLLGVVATNALAVTLLWRITSRAVESSA